MSNTQNNGIALASDRYGGPERLKFVDAAAVPPRTGEIQIAIRAVSLNRSDLLAMREKRVLIDGASGGVGSFAIQIARIIGADVTTIVGPRNVATARSLGAARVIDYSREDLIEAVSEKDSGIFDVIYAVNGHRSLSEYQRVLSPDGRFVMTGGSDSLMFQTMFGGRRFRFHTMKPNRADLERLLLYVASGRLIPMISDRFTLQETAAALFFANLHGTGYAFALISFAVSLALTGWLILRSSYRHSSLN